MKNANENYIEYARVINMCKGTKFENEPWKCIRGFAFSNHPMFKGTLDLEFAVAILEDEPVFVGDKIYWKRDNKEFDWAGGIITVDRWDEHITRKRTFMLGDVELPCPSKTGKVSFTLINDIFRFNSVEDVEKVVCAINHILEEAAK